MAQGTSNGFRNAQVTVLAPTGTIGFLMDCDTTGIEPDIALVKYKLLAGGGMLKIVNNTVTMALERLGYSNDDIRAIINHIEENDTIEGCARLNPEHLAVFDCAFKPAKGKRFIHHLAHIKMMAAVQPFISGAISKTVNIPHESTAEDIKSAYMSAWKMGLKAVAIYRDGSKRSQPLNTSKQSAKEGANTGATGTTVAAGTDKAGNTSQVAKRELTVSQEAAAISRIDANGKLQRRPQRIRLPQTRRSITHKFDVAGHEGYLTVGLYEDGSPGELFITMAKEGSTVGGLMDAFGTCISMAMQYGVPLSSLVDKFSHARFEPSGMTSNRDIPFAKSLIDYIARWLGMTFLPGYREENAPKRPGKETDHAPDEGWSLPANRNQQQDISRAILNNKKQDKLTEISNRFDELIGMVNKPANVSDRTVVIKKFNHQFSHFQDDAPVCDCCGSITVRNGNCYRCYNCGASMGCS